MSVSVRHLLAYYLSDNPRHTIIGPIRAVFRLHRFVLTFLAMSVYVVAHRALLPTRLHLARGRRMRYLVGRRISAAAGARIRRSGIARSVAVRSRVAPMIVCNHISWLDAFILGGELGARFVAEGAWGTTPILGTVLRAGGIIFIDRRSVRDAQRIGRQVGTLLERGERFVVFAEAGTSRGAAVQPFKGALLETSARARLPVSWAVLRYETPPGWPPASVVMGWPDWTPIVLHMYRAFHVPRIETELYYGREPIVAGDRKELARRLHEEVSAQFVPLPQPSPEEMVRIECPYSRWH